MLRDLLAADRSRVDMAPGDGGYLMHLDVIVDDLDAAEAAVTALGATKPEYQPGTSFRVFLDPADQPFCLCLS